jgi:hypothetical protein
MLAHKAKHEGKIAEVIAGMTASGRLNDSFGSLYRS